MASSLVLIWFIYSFFLFLFFRRKYMKRMPVFIYAIIRSAVISHLCAPTFFSGSEIKWFIQPASLELYHGIYAFLLGPTVSAFDKPMIYAIVFIAVTFIICFSVIMFRTEIKELAED